MANADVPLIILSYKYRLLPTRRQHEALSQILECQRQLYNGALEHRIGVYRKAGQSISLFSQMKELTELRQEPEYSTIPVSLQRWTLIRLDGAYKAFFRRVKTKGEKAGFPRFRGKDRWRSFGFAEWSGITIRDRRIRFKGLPGGLRIHAHRPLPEGKPRTCTLSRDTKGWSISMQFRVPVQALAKTGRTVGIDVGLTQLATLSTGEQIPNPRPAKRAEKEMRRRQRALSRCRRGSKRRSKVRTAVSRWHMKITNTRNTGLHQVSARLVRENDLIAVEKPKCKRPRSRNAGKERS